MTTNTNSSRLKSWLFERLNRLFANPFMRWLFDWPLIVVLLCLIAWGVVSHQGRGVLYVGIFVLALLPYYSIEGWLERLDYRQQRTRRRLIVGLYLVWFLFLLFLALGIGPSYLWFLAALSICVDGDKILRRVRNGPRLIRPGTDDDKAVRRQTNRALIKMAIVTIIAIVPFSLPASWLDTTHLSWWGMRPSAYDSYMQLSCFLFTAIFMASNLLTAIASWRATDNSSELT
jgi:hypothetical protein